MDICIGRDHGRGMNLLGAVHENLHGMDLHVLGIVLALETLQFLQPFLCITFCVYYKTAVNINGQSSLLVQLAQTLIYLLMELHIPGEAGIKDCGYSVFDGEINPTLKRRVNLLIGQLHGTVQDDGNFRCAFIHVSGHMSVLTHIIGKSGNGIRRIVVNAMSLKDF